MPLGASLFARFAHITNTPARRRQFFRNIGSGRLPLALEFQRGQLVFHAMAAEGGELSFEIVILAGRSKLVERLSRGLLLGYRLLETVQLSKSIIGAAHARH